MTATRSLRLFRVPALAAAALAFAGQGCSDDPGDFPYPIDEEGAAAFVAQAEEQLLAEWMRTERAAWVKNNFITQDTEAMEAEAYEQLMALTQKLATDAARFDDVDLNYDEERKLNMIKISLPLAAPSDPAAQSELAQISSELSSMYGRGEYCGDDGECRDLGALSKTIAESRDPDELLDAWTGWRTISKPMRDKYARFAELGNRGAQELGFADLGAMWRSGYDMDPDAFAEELDRLFEQIRPLYEDLHCYVREQLREEYGTSVVPANGPIPAHLLGNMWAQSWSNVYDLVEPPGAGRGLDVTRILEENGVDEKEMVRFGEKFFMSLGYSPLPASFWERSLFLKPEDRDVVCHASAWDLDYVDDLRIKMCIKVDAEDFVTVHHELGHNFYQRAYSEQPPLYRNSANDGFHEAIGDTVALSITPEYLRQVGLLTGRADSSGDLAYLMRMALDKVAFVPFGLLIDQWRWRVFNGEIPPDEYNEAWWELRLKYQGVAPPVERNEDHFDPGAKYHVPANTPYTRYFLAHILQFQFHRALCDAAGFDGPLHQCSIYGDASGAGARLRETLAMGSSRPWPDALEALTGEREMDATAMLDYFAPLAEWLDEQNDGKTCGW